MDPASTSHDGIKVERRSEFAETTAARIRPLLRLALALVETPHAAEALVEQVLSNAFQRARHLNGRDLAVWLSQRCVQLVLELQAHRGAAPAQQPVEDFGWSPPRPHVSRVASADDVTSAHELRRHVLRLPLEPRAALLLHELEGLSYAEIAHALERDVAAAKLLLHRARLALVAALDAATPGPGRHGRD